MDSWLTEQSKSAESDVDMLKESRSTVDGSLVEKEGGCENMKWNSRHSVLLINS
jgi:hypothetical protein